MIEQDPIATDPEHYRTLWENDWVRVLEYTDLPGVRTHPHSHPNSVMITLSEFDRRLHSPGGDRDVHLVASQAVWLPAQRHSGENTGKTSTHTIFVEVKGDAAGAASDAERGPSFAVVVKDQAVDPHHESNLN